MYQDEDDASGPEHLADIGVPEEKGSTANFKKKCVSGKWEHHTELAIQTSYKNLITSGLN